MILETLSNAAGVSGNEDAVRDLILEAIRPHVDDIVVDTIGNVIARKAPARGTKGAPADAPRVMVAAHMDEVGLMVTGHTGEGGIKFRIVGGVDDRVLPGARVALGKDGLPGVIGLKAIHVTKGDDRSRVTPADAMVIDIGATSKGEAEGAAPLGAYGVFATQYRRLGQRVMGKAFDDRAGCSVLVELLQKPAYPHEVYGVFTVQEEVGLRGAGVAAHRVNPTCAFVLEGTICDDLPKKKDESPTTQLGKGPALSILDRSVIVDRALLDQVVAAAEKHGIPYQFKQPGIGGTDAGAIHLVREGVPCVPVSVPCRYIHAPVAMLDTRDYRRAVQLMEAVLRELSLG